MGLFSPALHEQTTKTLQQKLFYTQIVKFTLRQFQILQKNSLFSGVIAGPGSETTVVVKRSQTFWGVQQGKDKGLTN